MTDLNKRYQHKKYIKHIPHANKSICLFVILKYYIHIYYNMECIICFENLIDECKINCSHSICKICLYKWIEERKVTCPICRIQMKHFYLHDEMFELIIYKKIIV